MNTTTVTWKKLLITVSNYFSVDSSKFPDFPPVHPCIEPLSQSTNGFLDSQQTILSLGVSQTQDTLQTSISFRPVAVPGFSQEQDTPSKYKETHT